MKGRIYMKRKLLLFLLISLLLSSCTKEVESPTEADAPKGDLHNSVHLDTPILVTSLGQSIDYVILEGILDNLNIEYALAPNATISNMENYNTIIAVVGSSKKGLKFSGVTIQDELLRTETLSENNIKENFNVILLHMGGKSRRGITSDEIIKKSLNLADSMIVVDDGNFDMVFSDYAESENLVYEEVADITKLQDILETIISGQ